jgi:hypothetical protein
VSAPFALRPELVWGLFQRLLGAVFLLAFVSLDREILALAGARGISPVAAQLARIRADFPGVSRFFRFPTLLWITSGDAALRSFLWLGALSSLVVIAGGPLARAALAACFVLYLSFDLAADLLYPWDCLLFEAGFLALFLPASRLLPDVALAAAPHPAIAWAFRFLLFRVVFGFGKYKFFGPGKTDFAYLHGFLSSQPLPTPLGFRAGALPLQVLKAAYAGVFACEVVAPIFFFVPGWPRVAAAAAVVALMICIQLAGNFGYFNLITAALCVPLLDARSSICAATAADLAGSPGAALRSAVALLCLVAGVCHLPFNSWVTRAWPFWPAIDGALGGRLRPLLALLRALVPFRLFHAYGVFGPESGPPVKWVPVIEVTRDGRTWRVYPYRYMPSGPGSRPRFVAPFCPRIDHATIYDACGIRLSAHLGSVFGLGHPYRFSRAAAFERLLQRVLEGSPEVRRRLGPDPFEGEGPPIAARARLAMMLPATREHARKTGEFWIVRWIMPHARVLRRGDDVLADWLRPPELFHPDDGVWARRAPALAPLLKAARAGDPACLSDADAALLWERFAPFVRRLPTGDLGAAGAASADFAAAFPGAERSAMERALGRAAIAITERERSWREADRARRRGPESAFELHLAALGVVMAGRGAFAAVLRDPAELSRRARDRRAGLLGLFVIALFWPEQMAYHAARARLRDILFRGAAREVPAVAPGFLRLLPLLADALPPPAEERLPRFERSERGDHRLSGDVEPGARILPAGASAEACPPSPAKPFTSPVARY